MKILSRVIISSEKKELDHKPENLLKCPLGVGAYLGINLSNTQKINEEVLID